ncbi:MAG TPA: hypothetical protein VMB48_15545 [Steroidobacteraceae bacterium]|nr:hypothetical protein [Steroidobacteraceae bacterium]
MVTSLRAAAALLFLMLLCARAVRADPDVPDSRDRAAVGRTRDRGESRLDTGPAPEAAAEACDRRCLQDLADTYVRALLAHDAGQLPLAEGARFTETGQELALGDGFWRTVSGGGGFRLYVPDVQAGEVGLLGTLKEFDTPVLMALRLKVVNRRISEVETLFHRRGSGPAWADAGVAQLDAHGADALWTAPIPPAARATGEALIAAAAAYLGGMEHYNARVSYPLAPDCVRLQDGARVTHNPGIVIGGHGFNLATLGCLEQLRSGWFASITGMHHRRIIADPDYGLALAWVNIDQAGTKAVVADGRTVPTPALAQPLGTEAVYAFRIENGLIRRIESLTTPVPYHMGPGWDEGAPPTAAAGR